MCIVFFNWRDSQQWPILIGANREEKTSRPIGTPVAKEHMMGDYPFKYVIAGEDRDISGVADTVGTWLGVNEQGMVVAITNRDDGLLKRHEMTKSRGLLAHSMLQCPSFLTAHETCVQLLRAGGFGGCNYIILDRFDACVIHAPHKDAVTWETIKPGIHCITNLNVDDPDDERVQFVHKNLRKQMDVEHFVGLAKSICSHERIVKLDPDHGTRASSVIAVGQQKTLFHHVVGIPTFDSYVDMTHMTENFCAK